MVGHFTMPINREEHKRGRPAAFFLLRGWVLAVRIGPDRVVQRMGHESKTTRTKGVEDFPEDTGRRDSEPKRSGLGTVGYSQTMLVQVQRIDLAQQKTKPRLA